MELPGAEYLYNLSILAVTFAAVSVLVTVVRQIYGGPLSKVDVHLLSVILAPVCAQTIAAVLPAAIALFEPPSQVLWALASGGSALAFGILTARFQLERRTFKEHGGPAARITFLGVWLSVLLLAINAAVPLIQGVALHAAALTLAMGMVMWGFVRRIASVHKHADWDLKSE